VPDRRLQGMWTELKRAIRVRWPEVTAADIASLGDERDALMRVLKSRSTKSYAQIDREIAASVIVFSTPRSCNFYSPSSSPLCVTYS
jgi:hypothetical protein